MEAKRKQSTLRWALMFTPGLVGSLLLGYCEWQGLGATVYKITNILPLSGVLLLTGSALFLALQAQLRGSSIRARAGSLLALVALLAAGVWFQRYTDLGILVAGGSGYWIEKAEKEEDDGQAKKCLRMALDGTQYGVNKAERLVRNLSPSSRYRLFGLLAEVAPNDRWRERFDEQSRGQP